jgi:hypothetical protein
MMITVKMKKNGARHTDLMLFDAHTFTPIRRWPSALLRANPGAPFKKRTVVGLCMVIKRYSSEGSHIQRVSVCTSFTHRPSHPS